MNEPDIFDPDDAVKAEFAALMREPEARQAFVEIREAKRQEGTRRRYEHVLRAVAETPWAIQERMLGVIVDLLAFRAQGGHFAQDEIAQRIEAARRPIESTEAPTGVAVIPLFGVITPKASLMSDISGATSVSAFRTMFRDAMRSSEVTSIVIDVDSPGGQVDQIPEMAAEMRAARGTKPVIAVANTLMASGAYWLASQADEIVVTRSGVVGSIGVLTAHDDISVANEQAGIKTTIVSAGKFKTEANPFEPLGDEARSHIQEMVDEFYGMFVGDVAKGRGVGVGDVRSGYGQGRVLNARQAVEAGMADRIGTLEDVVREQLVRKVAPVAAVTDTHRHQITWDNTTTTANGSDVAVTVTDGTGNVIASTTTDEPALERMAEAVDVMRDADGNPTDVPAAVMSGFLAETPEPQPDPSPAATAVDEDEDTRARIKAELALLEVDSPE